MIQIGIFRFIQYRTLIWQMPLFLLYNISSVEEYNPDIHTCTQCISSQNFVIKYFREFRFEHLAYSNSLWHLAWNSTITERDFSRDIAIRYFHTDVRMYERSIRENNVLGVEYHQSASWQFGFVADKYRNSEISWPAICYRQLENSLGPGKTLSLFLSPSLFNSLTLTIPSWLFQVTEQNFYLFGGHYWELIIAFSFFSLVTLLIPINFLIFSFFFKVKKKLINYKFHN